LTPSKKTKDSSSIIVAFLVVAVIPSIGLGGEMGRYAFGTTLEDSLMTNNTSTGSESTVNGSKMMGS
jgi:hypothetical protein